MNTPKRRHILYLFLLFSTFRVFGQDLFISEYIEGGPGTGCCNKCLEFYNPTNQALDLSQYTLEFYNNGKPTTGGASATLASRVSFTHLQAGQVLVLCHSNADITLQSVSDGSFTFGNYNGNDAVVLRKGNTIIDIIGQIGCNPGLAWTAGANSTKDATLIRVPCVARGNAGGGCDFPSLATEWQSIGVNNFSNLGQHTSGVQAIAISGNNALCQNTSIELQAPAGFASYLWSNGSNSSSITVTSAGTYVVTVTTSEGCTITAEKQVNGNSPPINAIVESVQMVSCKPKRDGAFAIRASGGSGGFSYSWESGNSTDANITNVGPGDYNVTVTDDNGCTTILPVLITGPTTIPLLVNKTNETCKNEKNGLIILNTFNGDPPLQYRINEEPFESNNIFTNLSPGTYEVQVRDGTGCGDSKKVVIEEGTNFNLLNSLITQPKCLKDGGGQLILRPSGGTNPFQVSVNNAPFQSNLIISDLQGGTYDLRIRDANGCTKQFTQIIEEGSDLEVLFDKKDASCKGLADGNITFSIQGGQGSIYAKIDEDIRPYFNKTEFSDLAVGKHKVVVGDGLFCEITEEFTIEEANKLEVNIILPPICSNKNLGQIAVFPQNGTPPYQFKLDSNDWQTTGIFPDLAPNNYVLTTQDSQGCLRIDTLLAQVDTSFKIISSSIRQESCAGYEDGQIIIEAISNDLITYSIDGQNFRTNNTFSGLQSGTYTIYAQSNGCLDSAQAIIQPAQALLFQPSTFQNIRCPEDNNGAITLAVTGGIPPYQYQLENGPFQDSPSFNNLSPDNYFFTVQDANGCQETHQEILFAPIPLAPECNVFQSVLKKGGKDGIVDIEIFGGTPPYAIRLIDSDLPIINSEEGEERIENLAAGNYVLEVTDNNGCQNTCSFLIEAPSCDFSINRVTRNISCFEQNDGLINLDIQNAALPLNITWSNPIYNGLDRIENLKAGNYSVTIVDQLGCTDSLNFDITQPPAIELTIQTQQDSICKNDSTLLTLNGGFDNYQWSNGSNQASIYVYEAGSYQVSVSDDNGCTAVDTFSIEVIPIDTLFEHSYTCEAMDAGMFITEDRNHNGCSFIIIKTIELARKDTTRLFSSTCQPDKAGIQTQTFTNVFGCDSLIINEVQLTPSSLTEIIEYDCDSAKVGMDTLHFTNQFLCDSQIIIKTLLAESHFIRKETQSCHPQDTGLFQTNFTNAFGCDSIIATSVKLASTVECQFRFTATGSNICQDQRLGSINIEIEAGTPPFRYFIFRENGADTLANGFINALQTPIIVDNIEIGRHQVYIQNQHHILSIQTVEIKRSPPIQLTAQISDYNGLPISCADAADGHISLSINGGMPPYSILWNNMETGNALQNLTAGTYAMTLTDAFNCSLSESFTLNEKDSLSTDYQIIRDLCSKETFGKISIDSIYHAHGQASYSLDGILFEPVGNLPLRLDNLVPGDNQFFIKDENNCQHIEPFHIHPPSQISLNLGSDTTLSLGENIILKPIANFDIARFEWSSNLPLNCTDCSELSIEANTNAFYHLTAYDENDCAISDTVQIQVKKETALYLPNAFSPNEDGHNDVYQIYSKPAVRLIKTFQIVDSEGRLMYQADNKLPNEADLGWDGQFNGQAMLPAVFIVFVEIELIDGSVESFVQTINLVK